jgi:hypothetical protein
MSYNLVDPTTGDLIRVAGGTLYADTPIGMVQATFDPTAPSGWLLLQGQTISRTEWAELLDWAVKKNLIGSGKPFGAGDGSTTFVLPDLREATLKGTGLTSKSSVHFDADGLALGEFVEDRIRAHVHNVYVRDTGHIHGILYEHGQFVPGAYGFQTPYVSQNTGAATVSSTANIQVSSKSNFSSVDNATTSNGYATTEVKAVGVNFMIKAKHLAVPTDFKDAIDDALSEFARPISLVPLNNSSVFYDKSRIIGGVVTICASITVQSGSSLTKENAVANVPNLGTGAIGYILPCLYRNTANGAEEPSFAIIQTAGNLYPYYTKTEYNEIRINASYSSKI